MTPSTAGVALTQHYESCRLEAYKDTGGVWTIGWGHTKNVKFGDTCTQSEADWWLMEDLKDAADGVLRLLLVPVTQGQFDALCDFTFNLGIGSLKNSTLLRKLNSGDTKGAAQEFGEWVYDGPMIVRGLVRRRVAEVIMFCGGTNGAG